MYDSHTFQVLKELDQLQIFYSIITVSILTYCQTMYLRQRLIQYDFRIKAKSLFGNFIVSEVPISHLPST